MLEDVEQTKIWKRKTIPPSVNRAATLHLHMQHYHDELLGDIGISAKRKSGHLRMLWELVAPYQPSDYAEVASGMALRRDAPATEPRAKQTRFGTSLLPRFSRLNLSRGR